MAARLLKIYEYDRVRAARREKLVLLREVYIELPDNVDQAREAAKTHALRLVGGRVKASSHLVGGGVSVTVDLRPGG